MDDTTKKPDPGFDGSNTVWLAQPVKSYGDMIDKLVLRKPNAKDLRKAGMPMRFSSEGEIIMDVPKLLGLVELLADVPTSAIEACSFNDVMAMQAAVLSFLQTSPSTSSTATTTAPGNGGETLSASSNLASMSSLNSNDRRSA